MVEKYKNFLRGGCTLPPVDLLRQVDIDLETPTPIQDAFDVMEKVLDEMEEMVK